MKKTIVAGCLVLFCLAAALKALPDAGNIFYCGRGNSILVLSEDIWKYPAINRFETGPEAEEAVLHTSDETDGRYQSHAHLSCCLKAIGKGWENARSRDRDGGMTPDPSHFVRIQGGTFAMGSDKGDKGEKPLHQVTLSDFYLSRYEVSVEEFSLFASATGYQTDAEKDGGSYIWNFWHMKAGVNWRHDAEGQIRPASEYNHPVIHVSWNDAVAYCNWRSEEDGLQKVYNISGSTVTANWEANGYRLPTEAEWEFAARSGGKNEIWAGTSRKRNLSQFANYWESGNSDKDGYEYTSPVGSFKSNALGLFDMSGNVWEWCWDWHDWYSHSARTNPRGLDSGSFRVLRGGSWHLGPAGLRCAVRTGSTPVGRHCGFGFRLARAAR
jgi:formylglycine-generating enzyme required for sulfatase activity